MSKTKEKTAEVEVSSPVEAVAKPEVVLDHNAIGLFKNKETGNWTVIGIGFNTKGDTGDFQVVKETGFKAEAIEWFKITCVNLGIFD